MKIIRLKLRYWWNNADLLHYTAIILLGLILGAVICYAITMALTLNHFMDYLNSH